MKQRMALALSLLILLTRLTGCTTSVTSAIPAATQAATAASDDTAAKPITLIHNKIEIDDALQAFAADYSRQTGITVIIETVDGGVDYNASLRARKQSGSFPDIFVIEGPDDHALWQEQMTDLSGDPWVMDTDYAYLDDSDRVVGFPVELEGYGMIYNKALLIQAEIDPATLTHYEACKLAFEKIDKMKKDLGIDAVMSMAASPAAGMSWLTGQQLFNVYLAAGLPYDDSTMVDQALAGTVDPERLAQYAEFVSLIFKYANQEVLLLGNYRTQVEAFAAGKTAFLFQGNWVDPTLADLGADFERAFAPCGPFLEPADGLFVAPAAWYCVNQESEGSAEARAFLTAVATTAAGHRYMVQDAQMVPAFQSVRLQPALPLSRNVQEWAVAGKTYGWQQRRLPAGFGPRELGPIFEQLALELISPTEFADRIAAAVATID